MEVLLREFIIRNMIIIIPASIIIIITVRLYFIKPKTKIVYFMKNRVDFLKAYEDTETVAGISSMKDKLLVFNKQKDVSSIPISSFGRITNIWICIEGYPFVVNMNALQDIAKKAVNEEFMALYQAKLIPEIIRKVIAEGLKDSLFKIVVGIFIGITIGFLIVPLYLQYFGFIPSMILMF